MTDNLIILSTNRVNPLPEHASPCISKLKFLVVLCIGCYSAFTFLFSLALQGYQPFRSTPPTGRCNKLFTDAKRVAALPQMKDTEWGYRYDAGHSGVMVCTDLPLSAFTKEFADNKKVEVSDPWAFQAKDWTSGNCNLPSSWSSWFSRIDSTTPIECPPSETSCGLPADLDQVDPLISTPAPSLNSTMASGRNGPWWDYAITFTLAFNSTSKSDCGAKGPDNGIALVPNDLPKCEKNYVWAFESNQNDLILYYKVILILFFVPHGMYIIMGIRFWLNVGTRDAVAARFYADGHSGLGSLVFMVSVFCCCCCSKGELLNRFEAKYVYTKAGILAGLKGTDKLPPASWLVFIINLSLSLVEASFTVIALWGCKPEELTEPAKLMLLGVLVHAAIGLILTGLSARPKKRAESRAEFEKLAVQFQDAKQKNNLDDCLINNSETVEGGDSVPSSSPPSAITMQSSPALYQPVAAAQQQPVMPVMQQQTQYQGYMQPPQQQAYLQQPQQQPQFQQQSYMQTPPQHFQQQGVQQQPNGYYGAPPSRV